MSRSKKGGKSPGFEYWKSRLKRYGDQPGKDTKVLTHKVERRPAKTKLGKLAKDDARVDYDP